MKAYDGLRAADALDRAECRLALMAEVLGGADADALDAGVLADGLAQVAEDALRDVRAAREELAGRMVATDGAPMSVNCG